MQGLVNYNKEKFMYKYVLRSVLSYSLFMVAPIAFADTAKECECNTKDKIETHGNLAINVTSPVAPYADSDKIDKDKYTLDRQKNLAQEFRTGDIIIFSGHGTVSDVIKLFTKSKWSHVGMAIRNGTDNLYILEATTLSDVNDVVDDVAKKGVQLVPLRDRLNKYDGDISIKHLQGAVLGNNDSSALKAFMLEVEDRPYEQHIVDLAKAALARKVPKDGMFHDMLHNEGDLSSLFCSELIAEAYQRLNILNNTEPSDYYLPKDFSDSGKMLLLRNATIGPEIALKNKTYSVNLTKEKDEL